MITRKPILYFSIGTLLFLINFLDSVGTTSDVAMVRLRSHVPKASIAKARHIGRLLASRRVSLGISLNLRDPVGLMKFISRQQDPSDSEYGHFLTPQQFTERFAASQRDVDEVSSYFSNLGFQVTDRSPTMIHVAGSAEQIENALGLELHQYASEGQGEVFAPNADPLVESKVAAKISGISGLNNFQVRKPHYVKNEISSLNSGKGPNGGLAPADIQKAYGLNPATMDGSGQTLALFELDGYVASDIDYYNSYFKISNPPPLQNILVDQFNGSAGVGIDEVTLDIELMIAVAPKAKKILVYEGPNSDQGFIDVFQKIANDNLAQQVSTSWGASETELTPALFNSENAIFMQMAAQGQSVYAASGDSGAYLDGTKLAVLDPASQPYVVATGGTTLTLNSDGSYGSEKAWSGSGGGVSSFWKTPTWQAGSSTAANKGSASMRMVPDISADADPGTGYAIYVSGGWNIYGGTSCAAPIWAAFNALVNQQRVSAGKSVLGFPNPALYQAGVSSVYSSIFHDIKDNSSNGYYPAVSGYDLSTGLGSMKGADLASALSGVATPPATLFSIAITPHNQVLSLSWPASAGALSYSVFRGTSSGGPFVLVTAGATKAVYEDVNLVNGTIYYYYVVAENSVGINTQSSVASAAPQAMLPRAPTNVQAH